MDLRLLHALNGFAYHHDGFEDRIRLFVVASEVIFIIGLIVLAVGPGSSRSPWRRRASVTAGVSAAMALAIGAVISHIVDRSRPFVTDASHVHLFLKHAPDPGFPSDHATAAFAIGAAIFAHRRVPGIVVLIAATIVAVGRVALGVHYPSDVAAGALLGIGVAAFVHLNPLAGRGVTAVTGVVERLP